MNQHNRVFIFGTDGCHLCDEAMALFSGKQWQPTYLDIIDYQLVDVYGDKIPVLQVEGAVSALFWPFETPQIKEYLEFYGINSPF